MNRFTCFDRFVLALMGLSLLFFGSPIFADSGATHQGPNVKFGVSGGNIEDKSRQFCCGGTLGSLVTDGSTQYILSNNHVLARTDQAVSGEDISQPGLIDNGCIVPPIVADFTVAPTLGASNVDAAIAQLRSGLMNSIGEIEDIGIPSNVVKNPEVGLAVAKSGRTTGFTTGNIVSVNTSVKVQYQKGCNSGKKFAVSYINQVVINSSTSRFSAGGDSGSLIVTNDSCHQPVGLLFAGSTSSTIGNPIGDVLTKVGASLESSITFVGSPCGTATSGGVSTALIEGGSHGLSQKAMDRATRVMKRHEEDLMSRPSVIAIGVGASDTDPSEAVIVIYVDQTTDITPKLPNRIGGVRVKRIVTDPFVAY